MDGPMRIIKRNGDTREQSFVLKIKCIYERLSASRRIILAHKKNERKNTRIRIYKHRLSLAVDSPRAYRIRYHILSNHTWVTSENLCAKKRVEAEDEKNNNNNSSVIQTSIASMPAAANQTCCELNRPKVHNSNSHRNRINKKQKKEKNPDADNCNHWNEMQSLKWNFNGVSFFRTMHGLSIFRRSAAGVQSKTERGCSFAAARREHNYFRFDIFLIRVWVVIWRRRRYNLCIIAIKICSIFNCLLCTAVHRRSTINCPLSVAQLQSNWFEWISIATDWIWRIWWIWSSLQCCFAVNLSLSRFG